MILTRRELKCLEIDVKMKSELISIDVQTGSNIFRVIAGYSAGTGSSSKTFEAMEEMISELNELCETDTPIVIAGDFNCPNIDWKSEKKLSKCSKREKALYDFVYLNGYEQKVSEPTRPKSKTILDLVICSNDLIDDDHSKVLPSPVKTDHLSVSFDIDFPWDKETMSVDGKNWMKADYLAIVEALNGTDWDSIMPEEHSIERIYSAFL